MAEKKIAMSDLEKQAQQLIAEGKMPSPKQLLTALAKVRKKYAPLIERARKEEKA